MWRLDGLCRPEADRKCPPSQPSPHWRQLVRSGEGAGAGLEGAAPSSAGVGPGRGSYSSAGGPPGQTPSAPSPSAAQRSQLPALPSPPPVYPSPVGKYREGKKTGIWAGEQDKGGRVGGGAQENRALATLNLCFSVCVCRLHCGRNIPISPAGYVRCLMQQPIN